jgi:hypothetical protein
MVEMPSETLDFNDATETEPEAESELENFAQNLHFTPPDSPAQESSPEIYNEQMVELILTSQDTSHQKISQVIPYILKSNPSENLSSSDFDAEEQSSPTVEQEAIPPAQIQLSRVALIKNLSACSFQNIQIMDASCDYLGLGFGDLSGVDKFAVSSQEDTKIEYDQNILEGQGKKTLVRNTSFGCSSAETLDVFVVGDLAGDQSCKVDQHIKNIFGLNKKQSYELLTGRADSETERNLGDYQNSNISEASQQGNRQIDSEPNFSNDEDLKEVSVETDSRKQILMGGSEEDSSDKFSSFNPMECRLGETRNFMKKSQTGAVLLTENCGYQETSYRSHYSPGPVFTDHILYDTAPLVEIHRKDFLLESISQTKSQAAPQETINSTQIEEKYEPPLQCLNFLQASKIQDSNPNSDSKFQSLIPKNSSRKILQQISEPKNSQTKRDQDGETYISMTDFDEPLVTDEKSFSKMDKKCSNNPATEQISENSTARLSAYLEGILF